MKRKSVEIISFLLIVAGMMSSCHLEYLNVRGVAYQSFRSKTPVEDRIDIQNDAKIIIGCHISPNGEVNVLVKNNTDKIMTIDRTKSFFRNQAGNSIAYYDPTVKAQSQSTMVSETTGASVNLGSIAGAAGIGGPLGVALGGITVGGSESTGTTKTNTTYVIDQPQISIAPHGQSTMGRAFLLEGAGIAFLSSAIKQSQTDINNSFTPTQTYAACNLCISYSLDDGKTFETIITDIYANSLLVSKVMQTGKVNDALRNIYAAKRDVMTEPSYLLYFDSDVKKHNYKVASTEILNFK